MMPMKTLRMTMGIMMTVMNNSDYGGLTMMKNMTMVTVMVITIMITMTKIVTMTTITRQL